MQRVLALFLIAIAILVAEPTLASLPPDLIVHCLPVKASLAGLTITAPSFDHRWRRKTLAIFWQVSERTIDRMVKEGRLGPPKIVGARTPTWSDEQRQAAERDHVSKERKTA